MTHAMGVYDLPDRRPGIFGSTCPVFKSSEIQKWLSEQIAWADAYRTQVLSIQKAEKKDRKRRDRKSKKGKKKSKRDSSSNSSSSRGSSSSDDKYNEAKRKRLYFQFMAKEKPGIIFASMMANTRQVLGQIGVETDMGPTGPVYRKWFESHLVKEHPHSKLQPFWDELQLLITALDEFHAGRMVEVGDILSSRLRMITAGIERGTWGLARRFLVYHQPNMSVISDELIDEAIKIDTEDKKRERAIAAARGEAPRR